MKFVIVWRLYQHSGWNRFASVEQSNYGLVKYKFSILNIFKIKDKILLHYSVASQYG